MSSNQTKFKKTEIGLVPEDWTIANIKTIGKTITGKTPSTRQSDFYGGKYPFITPTDISSDSRYVDCPERFLTEEGAINIKSSLLPKNAICYTSIASIGKIAITKEKSFTNQQINSIVVDEKVANHNFIFYLLKHITPNIKSMAGGVASPIINKTLFEKIRIILPLLQEQTQIAEILSSLDDKIELNQKMNETLEKIGQTLFKHWFVDFEFPDKNGKSYKSNGGKMIDSELGEIPEGWKASKIMNLAETLLGGTPSRARNDYWNNGEIPWINSGAINSFPIVAATEYITENGLKNSAAKLLPIKTVVLPFVISVGATINISILGIPSAGNQSVLGIIGKNSISQEFIYYSIQNYKGTLYGHATGGAQQHINKNNVDNLYILVPENTILEKFNNSVTIMFNQLINNSKENQLLSQSRDLLLPRLMSGKLRVK